MRVFICGSLRRVPREKELCLEFVDALGQEIVKRGHVLFNGCRSSLDKRVAKAATRWLAKHPKRGEPERHVIAYRTKEKDASHDYGTVRWSELTDWGMDHPRLLVPEQIARADIALFVAGHAGTFLAKNWAHYARKPILGIPRFGGAGEAIYRLELDRRRDSRDVSWRAYEGLNQATDKMTKYAKAVVAIAEEVVRPKRVFIAMPFDKRYDPVYESFARVCRKLELLPDRTDKSHSQDRINARIEKGIRECGYFVAHVTAANPNIFFEVGFARGQGKPVMLVAKRGTSVPFDVEDLRRITYSTRRELERELEDWLRSHSERLSGGGPGLSS